MLEQYYAQQLQSVAYLFEFRITVFCAFNITLNETIATKVVCFSRLLTNSVDPDQTAPLGAVCSGSSCSLLYLIRQ